MQRRPLSPSMHPHGARALGVWLPPLPLGALGSCPAPAPCGAELDSTRDGGGGTWRAFPSQSQGQHQAQRSGTSQCGPGEDAVTGPWGSVEGLSAWGLQMQFCDVNGWIPAARGLILVRVTPNGARRPSYRAVCVRSYSCFISRRLSGPVSLRTFRDVVKSL